MPPPISPTNKMFFFKTKKNIGKPQKQTAQKKNAKSAADTSKKNAKFGSQDVVDVSAQQLHQSGRTDKEKKQGKNELEDIGFDKPGCQDNETNGKIFVEILSYNFFFRKCLNCECIITNTFSP